MLSRGVPVIIPHSEDPLLDELYAAMGVEFTAKEGDNLAEEAKAFTSDHQRFATHDHAALLCWALGRHRVALRLATGCSPPSRLPMSSG